MEATNPEKHVFFVRSRGDRPSFVRDVFDRIVPELKKGVPGSLSIALTDRPNPTPTLVPLRADNLLFVSVGGRIDPEAMAWILARGGGEVFGYRVEESKPIARERTWPLGTRTPGQVLLTLLVRRASLSHSDFMHEWHGVHTPKAMRIHPMCGYVRDVVVARPWSDSPAFDGVVSEHYPELEDITNPVRMFGGPLRFVPRMIEIGMHVSRFLDLKRTENYLVSEFILAEGAA